MLFVIFVSDKIRPIKLSTAVFEVTSDCRFKADILFCCKCPKGKTLKTGHFSPRQRNMCRVQRLYEGV